MSETANYITDVLKYINDYFGFFGIPGINLLSAILILIVSLVFRRIFSVWALKYIRRLTARTRTTLDDTLIDILNPPLSFLFLLIGISMARTVVVAHLNAELDGFIQSILQFGFVIIVCWLIYRSADVFTSYLEKLSRRTETELDDILAPYLKKIIKIAAIMIIFLKGAEIFLGMSAAALFGFLGGMGLTLGLVFKDIIANWFGCGIIYIDNLFREGDWIQLNDGNLVDADVEHIGLRSTTFRNFDKTISIVPECAAGKRDRLKIGRRCTSGA